MKLRVETALSAVEKKYEKAVFATLVKLIHWADFMDMVRAGERIDLNEGRHMGVMLAPFQGFGAPVVWQQLGSGITVMMISETLDWFAAPDDEAGSLAERMLIKLAPTLATITDGYETSVEVTRIIKEMLQRE